MVFNFFQQYMLNLLKNKIDSISKSYVIKALIYAALYSIWAANLHGYQNYALNKEELTKYC